MNIKTHATLNENIDFKPISSEGVVQRNHFLENQTAEMRQEISDLKDRLANGAQSHSQTHLASTSMMPRASPDIMGMSGMNYSQLSTSQVIEDDVGKYLRIIQHLQMVIAK